MRRGSRRRDAQVGADMDAIIVAFNLFGFGKWQCNGEIWIICGLLQFNSSINKCASPTCN